jgi:thiamine pyrophosphate-dependent acetolactate synthase large subunit-like protein
MLAPTACGGLIVSSRHPRPAQVLHGITDALAAEGVDVVFGVVGAVIDRMMLDWITRHGRRYVAARHEQGAVHMADGYARATGRVGIAAVAQGPGLTNAATALTAARSAIWISTNHR